MGGPGDPTVSSQPHSCSCPSPPRGNAANTWPNTQQLLRPWGTPSCPPSPRAPRLWSSCRRWHPERTGWGTGVQLLPEGLQDPSAGSPAPGEEGGGHDRPQWQRRLPRRQPPRMQCPQMSPCPQGAAELNAVGAAAAASLQHRRPADGLPSTMAVPRRRHGTHTAGNVVNMPHVVVNMPCMCL